MKRTLTRQQRRSRRRRQGRSVPHGYCPENLLARARRDILAGRAAQAAGLLEQAIATGQGGWSVYHALGECYVTLGAGERALRALQQAYRLGSDRPGVLLSLGRLLCNLGRPAEAIPPLQQALQRQGDLHEARFHLARAYADTGQADLAEGTLETCLQACPANGEAVFLLARLLKQRSDFARAQYLLEQLAQREPGPAVFNELATLHHKCGQPTEAIRWGERAIATVGRDQRLVGNLATCLLSAGRIHEANDELARAVQREPGNPQIGSARLLAMQYDDRVTPAERLEAHRQWGQGHAPARLARRHKPVPARLDRPMRVGFVSPDLRNHPVGRFLDPLLSDVDRNELTLLGFGQIARADGMTHRLADGFDFYTNLYGLDDDAAADTIAAQQVDLLIDLAGHTAGNRLGVLARRPAPVQATWLGYPDTTGMAAVGYRLVDALTDPPDQPSWCSERLIRMDGPMHCYVGPESPPDVGDLPARHNGVITFGSFNNNRKLSHPTLDLWARLLGAVPQSRLVLKFRPGGDEQVAGHYRDAFAVRGIDPERVEVLAPLPEQDYLRAYQQIDIALDPVGYHGTTTTCEALWMGVPVVSLQGHRHASRVGGSLLNAVGLSHLAVSSPETFIRRAAAMAGDKASLSGLRRSLRERMQHSPLCDRAGFARRFEHACRSIRADAAGRG